MAALAQDPSVLRVATLLEIRQRLEKSHAELVREVAAKREQIAASRDCFQEELLQCQHTEERAQVQACEAAREAETSSELRRNVILREEIREHRRTCDGMRTAHLEEAERLRAELSQQDEELREIQALRTLSASRAVRGVGACGGDGLGQLRVRVAALSEAEAELSAAQAVAATEVDVCRAAHSAAERDATDVEKERFSVLESLEREAQEHRAEEDLVATQLANAREHCRELSFQLAFRAQCAYEGRLSRREISERGVQTKRPAAEARLREQIRELSEQLDDLTRERAEQLPWWALCLQSAVGPVGGRSSRPNAAVAAGAGAALMRAARRSRSQGGSSSSAIGESAVSRASSEAPSDRPRRPAPALLL